MPADSGTIDYTQYNILLVDDTPHNLDILVEFLQEYGFGLRIARSGESALQRINYDAPDIILLDVLLPGIDGFETCRQLKADPSTADIPIIFMTSLASAEDKVRGFEVGAVDYVTKPLQQAEVLARIITHLRQREFTQNLQAQNQQISQSNQVERARLLEAVAQQRTQLRTLASKLTEVQEGERQRLSRELHDEMGQALTAIRINLSAVQKELLTAAPEGLSPRVHERLTESTQLTDDTLEQIRELAQDLRPSMLDDLGLIPTLRWYTDRFSKRTNIPVDLQTEHFDQTSRVGPLLETALYRILQESLTNVVRHAEATKVTLTLTKRASDTKPGNAKTGNAKTGNAQTDDAQTGDTQVNSAPLMVCATIEDNGCGFDPERMWMQKSLQSGEASGIGLLGINERVTLLSGTWAIDSAPGSGTRIYIQLPLEQPAMEKPVLEQPVPEQPAPEQPVPEQATLSEAGLEQAKSAQATLELTS